ncbi:MAG: hypothetical protein NTZ81_09405 [Actinobacteria bacterium]|nr:hypothetical protein [Actinomycetota bacterium]
MSNPLATRSLVRLAVGLTVAITVVGGVAYAMRPATAAPDPALSVSNDQRSAMLDPNAGSPAAADLQQWKPRVVQRDDRGDGGGASQPLVVPLEEVQVPAVQAAEIASATLSTVQLSPQVDPRQDDERADSDQHSESDSDDQGESEGWDD